MQQMMNNMFIDYNVCMNGGSKQVLFQMIMMVNMIIQMIMILMNGVKTSQFNFILNIII